MDRVLYTAVLHRGFALLRSTPPILVFPVSFAFDSQILLSPFSNTLILLQGAFFALLNI